MNSRLLKLLIMSLAGLIAAQACHAKWYRYYYSPRNTAEKTAMLQDEFNMLYEKNGFFSPCDSFLVSPKIIGFQGYKVWPKQRRKLMRAELDGIKNTLLSFPSACAKKEAIENLQRRMMLLKKAQ